MEEVKQSYNELHYNKLINLDCNKLSDEKVAYEVKKSQHAVRTVKCLCNLASNFNKIADVIDNFIR